MQTMKLPGEMRLKNLCRVGPGTPAGEWFRRYWVAVGTTHELKDIPQAVKVLGEDLVLFRDEFGRVGLLGAHCRHRGASLEYGDIQDGGLRCPYHGWLFDVGGAEGQHVLPKGETDCVSGQRIGRAAIRLYGARQR
jgi:nitrite reductase/ring-hydroxylating ferredoxin subunit